MWTWCAAFGQSCVRHWSAVALSSLLKPKASIPVVIPVRATAQTAKPTSVICLAERVTGLLLCVGCLSPWKAITEWGIRSPGSRLVLRKVTYQLQVSPVPILRMSQGTLLLLVLYQMCAHTLAYMHLQRYDRYPQKVNHGWCELSKT